QPAGTDVTWQSLQLILGNAVEHTLGSFAATPSSGPLMLPLTPDGSFVADLTAGGPVGLHLISQSAGLGFTFHSRNFGDPSMRPVLLLSAAPLLRGDMNCDAILDIQDIGPFIQSMLDPSAYAAAFPGCDIQQADVNGDGTRDGRDVAAFANSLLSP